MSLQLHNKLNTLWKKIEYLQGKTEEVSSEVRDKFKEALDILSEKQEVAQKTLQALKAKDSDKKDEVKSVISQILEDLEDSYDKAITYVSRKTEEYETSFIGSELKDIEKKIVALEENAQRREMKDLKKFQKTMQVLRTKRERAQKKFQALQEATADTWDELKVEMKALLEDLHYTYENTRTYFPEYRVDYQEQVEKTLAAFDETISELLEKTDKSETETPH
jgi:hypothetical protein